jgi:hypothetical protein
MVEFKVLGTYLLCQRIRNPHAGSGGAKVGEAVVWCFLCLCVGFRSGGGGRFSLSPLFFEKVGFLVGIPHGGDDMVFRSTAVRVADDLSSPVRIKMTIDARSIPMMRLRDGAGARDLAASSMFDASCGWRWTR